MECNNPPTDSSIHHHLAANLLEQVLLVSFVLLSCFLSFSQALLAYTSGLGKMAMGNTTENSNHGIRHLTPTLSLHGHAFSSKDLVSLRKRMFWKSAKVCFENLMPRTWRNKGGLFCTAKKRGLESKGVL